MEEKLTLTNIFDNYGGDKGSYFKLKNESKY
jgi:hypothetical protein